MKTVIIGGVAAGMSAASKLKRLLKEEAEIVVYEKGGEVSYGACGIPFYISDHIKQGKDLIARTAEEFAQIWERNAPMWAALAGFAKENSR